MSDLIFFPAAEAEIVSKDKPKGPYVHLSKTFRTYQGADRGQDTPEYVETEEDYFMDVSAAPNFEAIQNIRIHQRARVLGFGNFPKLQTYMQFAALLKQQTDLALEDVNNPTRKALEAKIRAEIEAEQGAKAAQPPKVAKGGKVAKEESEGAVEVAQG